MRLLLERFKRGSSVVQENQEGLPWKVVSSCLKKEKEPVPRRNSNEAF